MKLFSSCYYWCCDLFGLLIQFKAIKEKKSTPVIHHYVRFQTVQSIFLVRLESKEPSGWVVYICANIFQIVITFGTFLSLEWNQHVPCRFHRYACITFSLLESSSAKHMSKFCSNPTPCYIYSGVIWTCISVWRIYACKWMCPGQQ